LNEHTDTLTVTNNTITVHYHTAHTEALASTKNKAKYDIHTQNKLKHAGTAHSKIQFSCFK